MMPFPKAFDMRVLKFQGLVTTNRALANMLVRFNYPGIALLMVAMGTIHGCAHSIGFEPGQWINGKRNQSLKGVEGEDAVMVCLAVVERPMNDPYIHTTLWEMVDEQVIPFEKKIGLAENGIRAGVLGGQPPQAFLDILGSDRSCINPRQIQTRLNQPVLATIGTTRDELRYQVRSPSDSESCQQTNATCQWEVIIKPGEPGKLKVALCPQVKHGETQMRPRAVQDKTGILTWQLQTQQQFERYPACQFEMDVRQGEFVLVGAYGENATTIGSSWFRQPDPRGSVQRLLVIRTARMGDGANQNSAKADGPRPLALLAQEAR